jgi:integrase
VATGPSLIHTKRSRCTYDDARAPGAAGRPSRVRGRGTGRSPTAGAIGCKASLSARIPLPLPLRLLRARLKVAWATGSSPARCACRARHRYHPLRHTLRGAAVAALEKLNTDSEYWFTSGKARPPERAKWSRYLDTVFELAIVKDAHSHRFRDSLLENGVSIENVSVLLGHSFVRITERHYKPWVKTLQKKLEDEAATR